MSDLIAEPFIDPFAAKKPPHEDFEQVGSARYYHRLAQGSQEWLDLRRGILTASEFGKILTPTLKVANNKDTRTHIYDLASQRISGVSAPHFVSWDMERGKLEEVEACKIYAEKAAPVSACGFITNDALGFPVGFSPDGLVGNSGFIEVKSRLPKYQVQTIAECIRTDGGISTIPAEFMMQVQVGFFVTGREWCDFISYSNGLNMAVIRVEPIPEYQDAIEEAATAAEERINRAVAKFTEASEAKGARIYPVEYIDWSEEMDL